MPDPLERFADARILVVDDNHDNLALLAAVLTRAGVRMVHTESDSREVLGRLADIDPDLVLLDLHMPHLDGYEVLHQITTFAGGAYLPVLVLSADTTRAATHRALDGGAQDFVTKPFDNVELLLRVRNLLETRFLHLTLRHSVPTDLNAAALHLPSPEQFSAGERRSRIQAALEPGGIRMAMQPIVDTATSETVGYEALARFAGPPQRSPDKWFAEAAEVGLGTELELAAIELAVQALGSLAPQAFLAMNISPTTVLSGGLDGLLSPAICPRVVLELTEHIPVENYDTVLAAVASLRGHGVRLAVDDTGAGYAGFRHLLSLRPDVIKLDISLTRGVDTRASHRALASALAVFAEDVGAQLLAEGVETASEAATLRRLGISWMQGYHFGRPSEAPVLVGQA